MLTGALTEYGKISKIDIGSEKSTTINLVYEHTYLVILTHPSLTNKSGFYLISIQNSTFNTIFNLINVDNYTLQLNDKTLTISTSTPYGKGYVIDLGKYI